MTSGYCCSAGHAALESNCIAHPHLAPTRRPAKYYTTYLCLLVFDLQYAISKVAAAASKILSPSRNICSQPGTSPVAVLPGRSKRSFADFADAEAMSDSAPQQKHRKETFAWPSAEFSDEEEINSQAAASPACVGSELLQLGTTGGKHQEGCMPASFAQPITGSRFLLGESQTDAEE